MIAGDCGMNAVLRRSAILAAGIPCRLFVMTIPTRLVVLRSP